MVGTDNLVKEGYEPPELSEDEIYDHYGGAIANGLEATKLCEVVEVRVSPKLRRFDLLCRVKKESEKDFVHGPIQHLLFRCDGYCEMFTGKEFFLKLNEKTGKKRMVYAWVISLAGKDPKNIVQAVSEALDECTPKLEVTESPLLGPGTPQGSVGAGRGVPGSKGAAKIRP